MKTLIYKTISIFFYHLGDIVCHLDFEWAANLYQKFMNISVNFDEKIGFQIWKESSKDE